MKIKDNNTPQNSHKEYKGVPFMAEKKKREELNEIGSDDRKRFRATLKRKGWRGKNQPTLLFVDVVLIETGEPATDHQWFSASKIFDGLDLQPGDIIEFDARVKVYKKGYWGDSERKAKRLKKPPTTDWKLSYPINAIKVGKRLKPFTDD